MYVPDSFQVFFAFRDSHVTNKERKRMALLLSHLYFTRSTVNLGQWSWLMKLIVLEICLNLRLHPKGQLPDKVNQSPK